MGKTIYTCSYLWMYLLFHCSLLIFHINIQIGFAYPGNPKKHSKGKSDIRKIFQNLDLNGNDTIEPVEIDGSLKGQTLFQ